LNTYKKNPNAPKLDYDIHFWLGDGSSQDERGIAAYKTVELDTKLGDVPVQFRQTEGNETDNFKKLFPNFTTMKGGIDSGFTKVGPKQYKARLLVLKGKSVVTVAECKSVSTSEMNDGDVFVLDNGLTIYQWNGSKANVNEKAKGTAYCNALKSERGAEAKVVTISAGQETAEFWALVGGKATIKATGEDDSASEKAAVAMRKLFQVSDASGTLKFTEIASGSLKKTSLKTEDVFIVDSGTTIFVWIGKKSTANEKKESFVHADKYARDNKRPNAVIARVGEGVPNADFDALFT
jgi:gelsolin